MGLIRNPKVSGVLLLLLVLGILGLVGGALGRGLLGEGVGGFLQGPIAHIQLPAEPLTPPLFSLGPLGEFSITNTMVAAWLSVLLLVVLAFLATRRPSLVPGRLQNLVEMIMEAFLNLAEAVAGKEGSRRFFPLAFTIFIFILTSNWLGILPGFGTIGLVEPEEAEHFREFHFLGLSILYIPFGSQAGVLVPFFRSANTDVNTPLALALVAMFMVEVWGIRTLGFFGYLGRFINVRRLLRGNPGGIIDFFVGGLEAISELARLVSFTFRLFGNIFAGEVLLAVMAFLVPLIGITPFLGLELFVGFIQAFIFAMLTLVFAVMATTHEETETH